MADEVTQLKERLEALEAELAELRSAEPEPEPEPPRDPRREFGEQMLARINATRTPWLDVGGGDAR
jgi:cell division septum initiation protein DivIVA